MSKPYKITDVPYQPQEQLSRACSDVLEAILRKAYDEESTLTPMKSCLKHTESPHVLASKTHIKEQKPNENGNSFNDDCSTVPVWIKNPNEANLVEFVSANTKDNFRIWLKTPSEKCWFSEKKSEAQNVFCIFPVSVGESPEVFVNNLQAKGEPLTVPVNNKNQKSPNISMIKRISSDSILHSLPKNERTSRTISKNHSNSHLVNCTNTVIKDTTTCNHNRVPMFSNDSTVIPNGAISETSFLNQLKTNLDDFQGNLIYKLKTSSNSAVASGKDSLHIITADNSEEHSMETTNDSKFSPINTSCPIACEHPNKSKNYPDQRFPISNFLHNMVDEIKGVEDDIGSESDLDIYYDTNDFQHGEASPKCEHEVQAPSQNDKCREDQNDYLKSIFDDSDIFIYYDLDNDHDEDIFGEVYNPFRIHNDFEEEELQIPWNADSLVIDFNYDSDLDQYYDIDDDENQGDEIQNQGNPNAAIKEFQDVDDLDIYYEIIDHFQDDAFDDAHEDIPDYNQDGEHIIELIHRPSVIFNASRRYFNNHPYRHGVDLLNQYMRNLTDANVDDMGSRNDIIHLRPSRTALLAHVPENFRAMLNYLHGQGDNQDMKNFGRYIFRDGTETQDRVMVRVAFSPYTKLMALLLALNTAFLFKLALGEHLLELIF